MVILYFSYSQLYVFFTFPHPFFFPKIICGTSIIPPLTFKALKEVTVFFYYTSMLSLVFCDKTLNSYIDVLLHSPFTHVMGTIKQ